MPFRALGLGDRIFKAIQEAGYTEPTPIQAAAIPEVLAGNDLIGIAQTGTGKTAAFTLPILARMSASANNVTNRGIRTLVLAPTRELAVQIDENVRAYAKYLPEHSGGHGLRRSRRTSADPGIARGHGHHHRLSLAACSI